MSQNSALKPTLAQSFLLSVFYVFAAQGVVHLNLLSLGMC